MLVLYLRIKVPKLLKNKVKRLDDKKANLNFELILQVTGYFYSFRLEICFVYTNALFVVFVPYINRARMRFMQQ